MLIQLLHFRLGAQVSLNGFPGTECTNLHKSGLYVELMLPLLIILLEECDYLEKYEKRIF